MSGEGEGALFVQAGTPGLPKFCTSYRVPQGPAVTSERP